MSRSGVPRTSASTGPAPPSAAAFEKRLSPGAPTYSTLKSWRRMSRRFCRAFGDGGGRLWRAGREARTHGCRWARTARSSGGGQRPAARDVPENFRRALTLSIARVAAFSRSQLPKGFVVRDRAGILEERIDPIEARRLLCSGRARGLSFDGRS